MANPVGRLIVSRVGNVIQTLVLDAPVVIIGRAPESNLVLSDQNVSRRHAELRVEPEGLLITDLGSSNGTAVDGERLLPHQPHLLRPGARIQIGPFVLTYDSSTRSESDPGAIGPTDAGAPSGETPSGAPRDGEPLGSVGRVAHGQEAARAEPEPAGGMVAVAIRPGRPRPETRPTLCAPVAEGLYSSYLQYLPVIYQDADFLGRFLQIFESVWEPLEQRQDHIAMYVDPRTCPATFLPWLASWLELSFNAHWPESRRRRLLAEAVELYRWRGTRSGLTHLIEVCAGLTPEITEPDGQPFVFTVAIMAPPGAGVDRDLIEELVRAHKPAWAGYRLEFRP